MTLYQVQGIVKVQKYLFSLKWTQSESFFDTILYVLEEDAHRRQRDIEDAVDLAKVNPEIRERCLFETSLPEDLLEIQSMRVHPVQNGGYIQRHVKIRYQEG